MEIKAGVDRQGAGAFSGKGPSKVDRSGAYFARFVTRQVVLAGLASRCEVQVAYATGMDRPVSVRVDTFGTGDPRAAEAFVRQPFDVRPRLPSSGSTCVGRSIVTPRTTATSGVPS